MRYTKCRRNDDGSLTTLPAAVANLRIVEVNSTKRRNDVNTRVLFLLEFVLAASLAGASASSYAQTHDAELGVSPAMLVTAFDGKRETALPARATQTATAVPAADAPSMSFRNVVRRVAPSVVTVVSAHAVAQRGVAVGRESIAVAVGSGVVIDADGFVVTNAHVVEDGTELVVVLSDGSARPARLVGADVDTDVALLRVDGGSLQPIAMGDIGEVAVGDVVLAVGNPLGVGQTVTQGIVSGIRSVAVRDRVLENIIQTDAAINPGNSGGALVDIAGRLIAINCVILSQSGGSEGIGFAIPVDVVQKVAASVRKSGQLPRAWLGLLMGRASGGSGAPVLAIEEGAPSQRARLKAGDVIVSISGRAITGPDDVSDMLQDVTPGTPVNLCVQRDGHRSCADVALGARPAVRGGIRMLGAALTLGPN
jgi:S1-C subfamily serine protease